MRLLSSICRDWLVCGGVSCARVCVRRTGDTELALLREGGGGEIAYDDDCSDRGQHAM